MQAVTATGPQPVGRPVVDTGALWVQLRGRLRAFVSRRVSKGADVEDIVQWVFLRLHESRTSLRDADRVHAWLYRTARRAIADYYRTPSRRRELPSGHASDLESLAEAEDGAAEAADLFQAAECLAPLIDDMPLPYREAIVLADLQGMRLADVARSAGVSLSGMKSRVQRGRQRLKQLLLACCQIALDGRTGIPACAAPRTGRRCGCRPNEGGAMSGEANKDLIRDLFAAADRGDDDVADREGVRPSRDVARMETPR
jgi:RNA polymerase sigma-70 factor (ECF subfamily)